MEHGELVSVGVGFRLCADEVQFGDVVHGLPHLTAHPKQPILKTNVSIRVEILIW